MPGPLSADLAIVLVEPQNPGNIGMVCRAMANFGASRLRLVNPCQHLHPEARKFAVSASELLGRAELYPNLASALADRQCAIAATRRAGKQRGELLDLTDLPAQLAAYPADIRLGLVFGREDSGLSTDEVALCTHSVSIATAAYGSLNLAQAVIVFLYELCRRRTPATALQPVPAPLPLGELEPLFAQMQSTLERIAFLNPAAPAGVMNSLRRVLQRANLDPRELDLLRGMWSQIDWSARDWRGRKRSAAADPVPKDG
jgi:tRNA/rRNA methyltransferase